MRRPAATALVLAGLAAPAPALTPALAQPATQLAAVTAAPEPPGGPVGLLIRQAQYWVQQSRLDLAATAIERALASDPRNTQALAVAVQVEAARRNREAAAGYLARLQAAGGTAEQRGSAETALRTSTLDRAGLDEARRLAREGRSDDAAARYRQVFGGTAPTDPYALEYYQTLAGTAAGREEGLRGLSRLAAQPGADNRTQLANAQVLTYQPATRADGVRRLADLASKADVGTAATQAWRQALIWSGNDAAAAPLLEAYLKARPDDSEIQQRLTLMRTARTAGPGDDLRRQGFAQLEAGSLRGSAQQFEQALATNATDADALGGLGIVRLRENRPADAKSLLDRATAADPARAAQWAKALDAANYSLELTEARAQFRRGDAAGADATLRRAIRREVEDRTDAESLLGDVALRRNDAAEAEQHYRAALARRPGFQPAVAGLNQSLRAQGRVAEALPEARPRPAPSSAPVAGSSTATGGQAGLLRSEAARTDDPVIAAALLRQAVSTAPSDPWLRLDLARALRRQGRSADARAQMEELVARDGTPEASYAAALLAEEDGRPADAEALLDRIRPQRRTADMARLQTRVRVQAEVSRAAALLPSRLSDGRQRLLTLAARPDPSGSTAAAVIRAFGAANDPQAAAEAARIAQAANRTAGVASRITIAGALLGAGLETEATALAVQLDQASLSPEQRRDVASLRTGIAIRASDRLNETGNQAQAFEQLRPALASSPDNPDAQLALARLYQGARQPAEALRLAETVLARDPRNLDARRGAVDAAIVEGDRRRAEALVADAQSVMPRDSRVVLLQARVARAFGNEVRARRLLEEAAAQRQAELGVLPTPAFMSGAGVPAGLSNPFQRGGAVVTPVAAAALQDRVAREIAQELAAVQGDTALRVGAAPTYRTRSGVSGLDQLQEVSAPLEVSVSPGSLPGRVTAKVTPVALDAGRIGTDTASVRRFGSNGALATLIRPGDTSVAGAGLSVAYNRGDTVRAELGSTPLGFRTTSVLGMLEYAPRLTDTLRLRVTGERRPVIDSVLSWSGLRDPASGRTWGGVTSSGGHAQLEVPLGAGYAYAGGGYAVFDGTNVASNRRVDAGAGVSYPVLKRGDGELSVGLDLVYFGFDNNQRNFALGQGGYFSPQTFTAFNVPVDYRGKLDDLSYRIGGTVGYARFREDASPLFPNDPALQAQAVALASTNAQATSRNVSQNRSTFVGGVRVDLDYNLTPTTVLGASVRYDKSADFDETRALVRLQNRF